MADPPPHLMPKRGGGYTIDSYGHNQEAPGAMALDHPNAARVRELFAAFRNHDLATIQAVIPADAVWHFPGRHGQIAGSHQGRDAILGFLLKVQALTDGTFHLELIDVIANDARAVALFRGHGQRNDKTLDNPTCLVMRMRDGNVVEVWEYVWDLYHVDDFWT